MIALAISGFLHMVLGIVVSFFATLPPGPVNLSIIQASLGRNHWAGVRIAAGAGVAEFFYCLLAAAGVRLLMWAGLGDAMGLEGEVAQAEGLSADNPMLFWLQVFSLPLLLALGVFNWVRRFPEAKGGQATAKTKGSYWLGFSLNMLNPALLPLWLAINANLQGSNLLSNDLLSLVVYSLGVGGGAFLLLSLVAYFSGQSSTGLTSGKRRIIARVLGTGYLGFALYSGFDLLSKNGLL